MTPAPWKARGSVRALATSRVKVFVVAATAGPAAASMPRVMNVAATTASTVETAVALRVPVRCICFILSAAAVVAGITVRDEAVLPEGS